MTTKRRSSVKRPAKANRSAAKARRTRSARNALTCPDCGFKAAHAMGLGRHRSSRHGVVSKRQMMQKTRGEWLTREQAAKRANVHYNTIRQWERSGLVRSRKQGRTVLIDGRSLARAAGGSAGVDAAAALERLETFYAELTAGLKRLISAADASREALTKQRRTSGKR